MNQTRTLVLAVFLLAAVATGTVVGITDGAPYSMDDRPDDPTTTETVGYVDGYWYDDDLAVDDRDDAALTEDELESVVARSMARVEQLRGLTFEERPPVEVISRAEFREDTDALFGETTDEEQLAQSVTMEALFMVDRETTVEDEMETMVSEAVLGYYDPGTEEVVLVSDDVETPETDEAILGHELLHALQDQHFDLASYERETIDTDAAINGLVEGDAVWVERAYEERCEDEWDCVTPSTTVLPPQDANPGLSLLLAQPYEDGLEYVIDLRRGGDGWDAVNEAYDDPPASSSEVIRPGTDREPTDVSVTDDSSDDWDPLESGDEVVRERVGEVGMVSMFAAGVMDGEPSVIDRSDFLGLSFEPEFDQPYTDGWAGDELVAYVESDVNELDEGDARDRSAFVWESEWTSSEDATSFLAGYYEQLDLAGAEPVAGHQDTYEVDEAFPGAYYLAQDDDRVTIVRAPNVDALDEVADGAAPAGTDQLDLANVTPSEATVETTDEADAIGGSSLTGFGSVALAAVVIFGTGLALLAVRNRSD